MRAHATSARWSSRRCYVSLNFGVIWHYAPCGYPIDSGMEVPYLDASSGEHPKEPLRVNCAQAGWTNGAASGLRADVVVGLKGDYVRTLYGEGATRNLLCAIRGQSIRLTLHRDRAPVAWPTA